MAVTELDHPIFNECLSGLRDKNTSSGAFRVLAERAAYVLAVEATKNLELSEITVETPLTSCAGKKLKNKIVLVPILRAGLGLLDPFLRILPSASVGHIGLKRNEETARAECYLNSLPDLTGCDVLLLDPMLATGGSAAFALNLISSQKVNSLHCVSLIAAPEGLKKIGEQFPAVKITVGVVDEKLNDKFFIVPGLGDFGDRLFG